jgi:hypothetical protein
MKRDSVEAGVQNEARKVDDGLPAGETRGAAAAAIDR